MTKKKQIITKALEILSQNKDGVRYSELLSQVCSALPDDDPNSGIFRGAIWDLDVSLPDKVYKPSRGLFRLTQFQDKEISIHTSSEPVESDKVFPTILESDFYNPFAMYLRDVLTECTTVIPLGSCSFGSKWGTPDVIGVYRPRANHIIKTATEVTSAEIKLDTKQLITAYGQACAYKLFSHRSYLVVPRQSTDEDIDRLDALCNISGIGLILFDRENPLKPSFQIKVRASRHDPDPFYLNANIAMVADKLGLGF